MESRFIDLATVSEILAISMDQTYALVRSQQLRAIKIGGRGVYRVERTELEAYIQRAYDETERLLRERPVGDLPGPSAIGED